MNRNTNRKMLQLTLAVVSLLSIFVFGIAPSHAATPLTGDTNTTTQDRLEIPSIKLDVAITTAKFVGNTWDFSTFDTVAGFFEGLPMPGDHGNAIIGAHSELANRIPGPFFKLDDVQVGDQIFVTRNGVAYTYTVTNTWHVPPTDISPISATKGDVLTLLTCAGYKSGIYTTRLVVRAELTAKQ